MPKTTEPVEPLPVFHTAEALHFRGILEAEAIGATRCPIYGEDLVYLFYGRPGYRPSTSNVSTNILEYYPVVLVLDASSIGDAKRMLPFDSGGYASGRYSQFVHPKMEKEAFEIPPPVANLGAVISYFFGSNDAYLSAIGLVRNGPMPTKFEMAAFHRMVHATGTTSSDDRKVTCEIQSTDAVAIGTGGLRAVVAPSVFEDEDYFMDKMKAWGFEFSGYDCSLANSNEMHGVIAHSVKSVMKSWGL